jgi:hypothetical protein
MEVSGQLHTLVALPPGETALSTHYVGGWVGHGDGMDLREKRNISCSYRETNSGFSVVLPVA